MCGIIGIFKQNGQIEEESLRSAMDTLHHRGPDGDGIWISPERTLGLGHKRLSIIGLDNGTQPIANEDRSIQIVVNGEFYDFERIRSNLKDRGHRFRTESDSEIALHLYEEHGTDCLKYLRGEFAFILWDQKKRRLFAARDRFGIKPLCYFINEKQDLWLASEAKAIFAAGVKPSWDSESFFHATQFQYTLPNRTLFKGVYQLRPGHFLLAESGKIQDYSYWDFDYPTLELLNSSDSKARHTDEQELVQQFSERLQEAVRFRFRADTEVCCHLSGGLDSSSILGLASQFSSKPIRCFSVSFEEASYDEFEIAQEMANQVGAEFHPVIVSQADLIEHLPDAVYSSEGLSINGHLAAKYILNREIRKAGYKVALTGEGSDEILAGYPHLRVDLFRSEGRENLIKSLQSSNAASRGIMLSHGNSLPLDAIQNRLGFVPSFLEAKGTLGFKLYSILSEPFKNAFLDKDGYADLINQFDVKGQMTARHPVMQSLYIWSKTALSNYILRTLGDGTEMAHSVEGRLPFLDHHLFEFVRTLPLSMKINGTIEKYILRQAVRPVVTETIFRRQKHPFVAPPISRYSNPKVNSMIQDILRSHSFSNLPFFDTQKLHEFLDQLPHLTVEDQAAMDPVLMTALSATLLQNRFNLSVESLSDVS